MEIKRTQEDSIDQHVMRKITILRADLIMAFKGIQLIDQSRNI